MLEISNKFVYVFCRPNVKLDKHTILYDESQLLKEVEKRVGKSIQRLGPDLVLPKSIREGIEKGSYGLEINNSEDSEPRAHMLAILPTVCSLLYAS